MSFETWTTLRDLGEPVSVLVLTMPTTKNATPISAHTAAALRMRPSLGFWSVPSGP